MKFRLRSFKEIRPVEVLPMHAETRTDEEIDMTQVASTSCNKANRSEKWNVITAEYTVNDGKLQTRI